MISRFQERCSAATLVFGALVLASLCARVEARPTYKKVFDSTYPDVAKANKTNCTVCHVGDDDNKKKRNHYGKALAKELKKPKETDEKTIKDALKAIEKGECRTGKWKERLDENKWPCACGDGGQEPNSYIARQLSRERSKDR